MAEVASAYVSLLPSARGFGRSTEKQVDKEFKKTGPRIGERLGKGLKAGALGVVGAAGATIATALFKGFDRLQGIDQAESKLRGLGHTAESVDQIMQNALNSVRGTAFGLDAAATTAAGAVAAGVKPGQELERTLKLVADTATIAGVGMDEMGAIFNKVASSDMIQGDVLAQLGDKGIPVLKMLGDELGVTAAEVRDLASKGEIDFATFQNAMEKGLGGAAKESGKTFEGALANMQAALGRLGGAFLEGTFTKLPGLFEGITDRIDGLTPYVQTAAEELGELAGIGWGKLKNGYRWLKGLRDLDFSDIDGAKLGEQLGAALDTGLAKLGEMSGKLTQRLGELFGKVDWAAVGLVIGRELPAMLLTTLAGILSGEAMSKLWTAMKENWETILLGTLAVAFAPSRLLAPLTRILGKIPFVGGFLAASVRWLNQLGGKVTKFGGDLFRMFWRGFSSAPIPGVGLVTRIMGAFRALPGRLKNFWDLLKTRLGVWALDAFEAIGRAARGFIGGFLRWLGSIPGMIFRAIGSLARTLFPRGTELMTGLRGGTTAGFRGVIGFVRTIPGQILGALRGLVSLLAGVGRDMMLGLLGGIRSMASAVASAARAVVSAAIDAAKSALKMRSPSRVFRDIGVMTMAGYVAGVKGSKGRVVQSVADILGNLERSANPAIRQAEKWGDKLADALGGNGLTKKLKKRIKGMRSELRGLGKSLSDELQAGIDLRDAFTNLSDSITSAFRSDWFSATGTEAEWEKASTAWGMDKLIKPAASAVDNFLASLTGDKGVAQSVLAAFGQIKNIKGLSKEFLSALFQSGNSDLILGLAGGPASTIQDANRLFTEVNSLTAELGKQVGEDRYGQGIYAVRDEIRELRKDIRQLGPDVGKAINTAAAQGQRTKKRMSAKEKK